MKPVAEFALNNEQPIICTAIHAGKYISNSCGINLAIKAEDKLREEDPYTDEMAKLSANNIIANYSRFEFDINRKRESSIYIFPKDSWGLQVRKDIPDSEMLESAYQKYDLFYQEVYRRFIELRKRFSRIFIYDIHSYNHRRKGPESIPDDPNMNPDIILATGNMPAQWKDLVDKLQVHFSGIKLEGRNLDVRKNVKFDGGWFSRWLHYTFPGSVCCLSIEFKKIFMDEWTGKLDINKFSVLKEALSNSFPIIEDYLAELT